jgi:hypothetical protein
LLQDKTKEGPEPLQRERVCEGPRRLWLFLVRLLFGDGYLLYVLQ